MTLAKAISRQKALVALLNEAATALPGVWWVEDNTGQTVFGVAVQTLDSNARPVRLQDEVLGWVKGDGDSAALVANLLGNWLRQEQEKKQIGAETLHLYREINLIFSFSEKLSKVIGAEAIARLTLEEAQHVIPFTEGLVLFWDEKEQVATTLTALGSDLLTAENADFFGRIAQNGQSEIATDPSDASRMVLYASLKLGKKVLGCIALRGTFFAAADQKLLAALATPTAAALESAMRHEANMLTALKAQREQLMFDLALKNPFFKKLVAVVEAKHSNPDFSPSHLAHSQHLSLSQLQRKVSALTDLTVAQIIRDCRLAHARRLLKDPTLSISEVAYRSGFQDPSYFTRLFTKEMNCTPSEWRAREGA